MANRNWRRDPAWATVLLPRIRTRIRQGATIDAAAHRVDRLPCRASELLFEEEDETWGWGPTLKTILEGTRDPDSPLSALRGLESILVQHVYNHVLSKWAPHVTLTIPAALVGNCYDRMARFNEGRAHPGWTRREIMAQLPPTSRHQHHPQQQGYVAFSSCGKVQFPEPADRNVNMMPFIFGDRSSLPAELQCYYELIETCAYRSTNDDEVGKIGYLTVHEGFVQARKAQRREGLHIEAPGVVDEGSAAFSPGLEHGWGCGVFHGPDQYEGGIYMASNLANTSAVWDALVDKHVPRIVDNHGGCEHLRPLLGPKTNLKANQLIWMTDCTPHEALEQEVYGYRQFFRVVTSRISHWYARHSTPNPLVAIPDNVAIVLENKFDEV